MNFSTAVAIVGTSGRTIPTWPDTVHALINSVDVLVSFEAGAGWSLLDVVTIQEELAAFLGRPVDLIEEAAFRNPYRRAAILEAKQIVYAA